jgi:thiol-disulfide isomerase/thioredoxin
MLASLFQSMKPAQVPNTSPVTREDSLANYQYYKKHYWDGITFMDDRIIRTPFFLPKLQQYFENVIPQSPDSIIKDADYLLLLSRSAPEMYKFLLNWLTDEYIYPKYMGQDAVFVHLFNKYHSKGVSNWLNEKQIKTISDRAYMLMSNLIGEQAANLQMVDSNGVEAPLYNIKANYTVVVFWDPSCGHCQHEVPRLDSIYNAKWKTEGVKMYGVLTEPKDFDSWKKFIREKNLGNWVNVYETEAQRKMVEQSKQPSYKQLFDVTQTPTLYLLDKDKKIIAKKLTMEQLDDLLDVKIKNQTAQSDKK